MIEEQELICEDLKEERYLEAYSKGKKPWRASRKDILDMWRTLKPSPIAMQPISEDHKGTRFKSDGIRLTGSAQFINSVLSRLKDVLAYETAATKIDIEYRMLEAATTPYSVPKYVVYIYVLQESRA